MPKIERYRPGSFCWAELATTDPSGAKKFYSEMFGWTSNDFPIPNGTYTIFQSDGNDAAALYEEKGGVPPHWNIYFSVDKVDDSAAKAGQLGGKIVAQPFDVMGSGRMAIVQDPQGTAFCLWEAKSHIGATHGGPLNMATWPELHTPDPAGAVAFYESLFGWKTQPATGIESAQYVEWLNGPQQIGGLLPMRGDEWKGVPPHWMMYITVADCDERVAKAEQLGAAVCVPPTDIPMTGRFSVISDAQGATFSIIQMKHAHQPASA